MQGWADKKRMGVAQPLVSMPLTAGATPPPSSSSHQYKSTNWVRNLLSPLTAQLPPPPNSWALCRLVLYKKGREMVAHCSLYMVMREKEVLNSPWTKIRPWFSPTSTLLNCSDFSGTDCTACWTSCCYQCFTFSWTMPICSFSNGDTETNHTLFLTSEDYAPCFSKIIFF